MKQRFHALLGWVLVAAVMLGASLPWVAPTPATAQQTGLKDMSYVSPTWGYTIRWYSSEWTVEQETSDQATDVLALSDTLGNRIVFSGQEGFAGDADACLEAMIAEMQSIPGAAEFQEVSYEDGVFPFSWRDPQQAYIAYLLQWPVEGVLQDHAVYQECQTLAPGEAVFQRTYVGPPEVLAQWFDDIVETIEGVFLPASAWLDRPESDFPTAGQAPLLGTVRDNAALLLQQTEEPLLLVGLADRFGDSRVVTFENTGREPVTLDPTGIMQVVSSFASDAADIAQQPSAVSWIDGGDAGADGPRTLAPGERATVQVEIAPIDAAAIDCAGLPSKSMRYQHAADLVVDFAPEAVSECPEAEAAANTVGTSGSAGRPRLRFSR